MEKLKKCKACGTFVAKNAKICPNCGKKLKHPFLNFVLILVAIIVTLNSIVDAVEDNSLVSSETTTQTNNKEEQISSKESNDKENTIKLTQERVSADELINLLNDNALKASNQYKGKNIQLTGKITNIDASGDYFSLGPLKDNFSFYNINCQIEDKHIAQVINFSKGQIVTLNGKVSRIGEIIGYIIDVDTIENTVIMPEVNWSNQATIRAKANLETMSFSRDELIDTLESEGFSESDAKNGVNESNIDWNEQAVRYAEFYLDSMPYSKSELISTLERGGFTYDQAVYGVNSAK